MRVLFSRGITLSCGYRSGCHMISWFGRLLLPTDILGDPGAVSRVGRKGATKVFKHSPKSPWVPTLTGPFPNGQAIGNKKCFVLLCPIGEQFLLSSFREFVHDGYFPATFARFVHQAFLTRDEDTTDGSKNVSDAISKSNSICTEKIPFLKDYNVS